MLLPSEHLLAALSAEFDRLRSHLPDGEASALQSIGAALNLLRYREHTDVGSVHGQVRRLTQCLERAQTLLPEGSASRSAAAAIAADLSALAARQNLQESEASFREVLVAVEKFAHRLAADETVPAQARTAIGVSLNVWEIEDLRAPLSSSVGTGGKVSTDTEVTAGKLTDYLRRRFADPDLTVPHFRPLAGGFGKQTYLFDIGSGEHSGAYVMRRDLAEPVIDNDCHRIDVEYALIRAVHARGFPAPEALWIDTEHALLPGGNFLVMRRAAGVAGGSVFAAKAEIPRDLLRTLAGMLARLHALPPMPELQQLSESLNATLWELPVEECVRRYIGGYRALYEREPHLPSPALASLFGWLLDNIPPMRGRPVLLHGDIGFHNFLFDETGLTAVLDWEFGHLGDPSEDLAYACNTLGAALNTQELLSEYAAAGGAPVNAQRLRFFRVWGHVRNACASNLISAKFASGRLDDLKLALLPHIYIPQFIGAAIQLIEAPV